MNGKQAKSIRKFVRAANPAMNPAEKEKMYRQLKRLHVRGW